MTGSRKAKKQFTVYEVEEVTDWRVSQYWVEARTFEEATRLVEAGEADPIDIGYFGEPEYGESAFGRDREEAAENLSKIVDSDEEH